MVCSKTSPPLQARRGADCYQVLYAPTSSIITGTQNALTSRALWTGHFESPVAAATAVRADLIARNVPGFTIHSPLLMKSASPKAASVDTLHGMPWLWMEKNLKRLAEWEKLHPNNKRYKFADFESKEAYDRPWVQGEIVHNVGEINLRRTTSTAESNVWKERKIKRQKHTPARQGSDEYCSEEKDCSDSD